VGASAHADERTSQNWHYRSALGLVRIDKPGHPSAGDDEYVALAPDAQLVSSLMLPMLLMLLMLLMQD